MKRIVIVGASSGLGQAVAELLASEGWELGLAGRNTVPLLALQQSYPLAVRAIERIDINNDEAPKRLGQLISNLGGMDVYFHAAGIGRENIELSPDIESDILNTNIGGFSRMIVTAFQYMEECGHGQIAAITSVAGTKGIGSMAAYSSSKCFGQTYLDALDQLARVRRLDIKFTDIRPGWTDTPLLGKDANYPMLMSTQKVALKIVHAIKHCRRVATIDWRWRILVAMWRILPYSIWRRLRVSPRFPGKI
jgi:short-subunit dehydrogenase